MSMLWASTVAAAGAAASPDAAAPSTLAPSAEPSWTEEAAAAPLVLFLIPSDAPPELAAQLEQAVKAQVADVNARVLVSREDTAGRTLRAQMAIVQSLASVRGAIGVFWLDLDANDTWLLYLSRTEGRRVLVRSVEAGLATRQAAIEATSVIAGRSTAALVAGQIIGMNPVLVEADGPDLEFLPPPLRRASSDVPRAAPSPASRLALHASGRAESFAVGEGLDYGGAFGADFVTSTYIVLGVRMVVLPDRRITRSAGEFQFARHPFEATAGQRFEPFPAIWLTPRLLFGVDPVTRNTLGTNEARPVNVPSTRTLYSTGIAFSAEYRIAEWLGISAGSAGEIALNSFEFVAGREDRIVLLELRRWNLALEAGLAFYLIP